MPLTKQQKVAVVADISELLDSSKIIVLATYTGTSVKALQDLRATARANATQLRVVKNRLFKQALSGNAKFKDVDTSAMTGQILYAFNSQDEVAPAQSLANFAKTNPQFKFVGAINEDAQFLSSEDVGALAALPSKEQLRAQLAGTIGAPVSGFVNVLASNIRSVMNVFSARAEALGE